MGDKDLILNELRDGVLFSSWAVISQLKEGLENLGVLEIIRENKELLQQLFCYTPPVLCSGILKAKENIDKAQQSQKETYDRKHIQSELLISLKTELKNKKKEGRWIPYGLDRTSLTKVYDGRHAHSYMRTLRGNNSRIALQE